MSASRNQGEIIQKLLAEKEQLRKEEVILRQVIDKVKKQIAALQVEQLVVTNRVPIRNSPPVQENVEEESFNQELSLDVLNQMMRGTFEVEEEED